jgi:hypothetical protein
MKKKSGNLIIISIFLSSLLLASCSSVFNIPPTITLTPEGCKYSGPKSISADITVTLSVKDDSHESYGYVIGILTSGKTKADLADWKLSDPPPWFKPIGYHRTEEGNSTSTNNYLLRANAANQVDEVFFVCFVNDLQVGQAGPIKIKD